MNEYMFIFTFGNGKVFAIEANTIREAMDIVESDWCKGIFESQSFNVAKASGYSIEFKGNKLKRQYSDRDLECTLD